jgi:hypothetical protein
LEPFVLDPLAKVLRSSCHNDVVDVTDLRRVQARLGDLPRGEQAEVSLAVAEALRPLAELGEQMVAPGVVAQLLGDARPVTESVSLGALRQLLAEAEWARKAPMAGSWRACRITGTAGTGRRTGRRPGC